MLDPALALRAAAGGPVAPPLQPAIGRVLVVGGGGRLGSEVLERLLASRRFEAVGVLVRRPVEPGLRSLRTVDDDTAAIRDFAPDTALLVFDAERHANGRDEAFVRPLPDELLARARQLHDAGARHLLVAVPHAAALLPQALRAGLATLDEGAVAALGFRQLVFMRLAQAGSRQAGASSAPERLAQWMLGQLHWMIPSSEQPVRTRTVARVVAAVLQAWPDAPSATRVLPPELVWHVAQGGDAEALVSAWLAGRPLPAVRAPRQRW